MILEKVKERVGEKVFRFSHFLVREREDWEKIWPQLTAPKELMRQLIALLRGRYHLLVIAFLLEGVKAGATAAAMIALKKFLEPLETDQWRSSLWMLVAFLALNGIQLLAELGGTITLTYLGANLLCKLRERVFNKLLFFPLKFYQRLEVGSIINHIDRDVGLVVELVTAFLFTGAGTVFTASSMGIVIFALNWKVGGFVCLLLILCIPLVQIARTAVGKYAKRLFALHSQLLSILHQSLYAFKYLKAMGFEQRESLRIRNILEENRQLNLRVAAVHQALGPVMEFFYLLLICGGIWMGFTFFQEQIKLSLIAPLVYALLRLSKPVRQLIRSLIGLENSLQAAQRLFGTLKTEERLEEENGAPLNKPITSIKLQDVSYGYEGNLDVLEGVLLELRRGEMVMLMGESGAGKSTLCELIMGLHFDYRGQILVGGQELRQLNTKSYRSLLGYVPQEALLLRGTIRENLLYGCKEATGDQELIIALQRAHAWEFVSRLEEGLGSELGERGINLSGGERQRLCLARALLRNPEVLILDEATSSLDLENEAKILEALQKLKKEMIILLVSHRFSLTKFADRVVLIEEGKGREIGATGLEGLLKGSYIDLKGL
jgi:ABC-type multidrug transport system fused ATPase/permease subunit